LFSEGIWYFVYFECVDLFFLNLLNHSDTIATVRKMMQL